MIKSLKCKNFQAHADSLLEFDSGVNIIVGESDSGKTSLFRLLRWIKDNRPLGDSYIRDGQSEVQGEITVVDVAGKEHQITRYRDKKRNIYITETDTYEAMKADVPAEVTTLLNLSDINIQNQLSSHFMILDSPGEIARFINKITELDKVDEKIASLDSKRLRNKREAETKRKELQTLDNRINDKPFTQLDKIEVLVIEYESVQTSIEKLNIEYNQLICLIKVIEETEKELNEAKINSALPKLLKELDVILTRYNDLAEQDNILYRIIEEIKEKESEKLKAELVICQSDKVEKLRGILDSFDQCEYEHNRLALFINDIINIENRKCVFSSNLRKSKTEWLKLNQTMNVCPYCTSKLSTKTKQALLGNLEE